MFGQLLSFLVNYRTSLAWAVLLRFEANAQALGLLWVLLREEVSVFWLLGDLLIYDLLQNFDFGNLDATVVYIKLAWVCARR